MENASLDNSREASAQDASDPRPPRTVVVTWHWPPTNRASAGVLGSLFGIAPRGAFRVVTRSFAETSFTDRRPADADLDARVPPTFVPWPLDDQIQPTLSHALVTIRTVLGMIRAACKVGRGWKAERVIAVYPHRLSLVAGWVAARRLRVPLVLYMHDLCIEAITFRNPFRRAWWRLIDAWCLRDASLIVVPTEQFADHYRGRSVQPCFVLPHCAPRRLPPNDPPASRGRLSLVYSGAIYEPHAQAARAFVDATDGLENVRVTYFTDPGACGGLLGRVGGRWLPHREALEELQHADVLVVLLSTQSDCPAEVHGCFPSKIIDYLAAGRPILALAPAGSFVDRLVSRSGCGVVVRRHDPSSIREAIDTLRDARVRREMGRNARQLLSEFHRETWMNRLLARLAEPSLDQCPNGSRGPIPRRRDGEGGRRIPRTVPLARVSGSAPSTAHAATEYSSAAATE